MVSTERAQAKAKLDANAQIGARGGAGKIKDEEGNKVGVYAQGEVAIEAGLQAKAKVEGAVKYGEDVSLTGKGDSLPTGGEAHLQASAALTDSMAAVSGSAGATLSAVCGRRVRGHT